MSGLRVERVPAGDATAMEVVHALRRRVFVVEQQISEALEWDDLDAESEHFLARREDGGSPIGTARLRFVDGRAKVERVAVLADERESGVGRAVMTALESRARDRGCTQVVLHAQVDVLGFYERLGYVAAGPVFDEAGIDHRAMDKTLD